MQPDPDRGRGPCRLCLTNTNGSARLGCGGCGASFEPRGGVLVTGGAGFIASHFVLALVPSGHFEPAGHSAQLVRVVFVPPEVKEPSGHTEHSTALFEL